MSGATWQRLLDDATTEQAVISVARDFIAHLDYFEIQQLPEACRPPRKFVEGKDITSYAFDLLRHHCSGQDGSAELIAKLAAFFSQASIRLSQLAAVKSQQRDDQRQDDQQKSA